MTWLYTLHNKDDVFDVFQSFHVMIQTQCSAKLKILRSDNGEEYINKKLQAYFQLHRLIHEISCAQTPQQNGFAERKHQHILETACALLIGASMPRGYWTDAIATVVHLINLLPSKLLDFKTPMQTLSEHVPLPTVRAGPEAVQPGPQPRATKN
jgi:hypothetical protein